MEHVAIIVPIYKPVLSNFEVFSLSQLSKILSDYPIIFVYPEGMDLIEYKKILTNHKLNWKAINFSPAFFVSTESYNKLLLSLEFFIPFQAFDYILIYQLDALVFKNDLEKWVNLNFDYIGAPWLDIKWENLKYINSKLPFWAKSTFLMKLLINKDGAVGNGGFSLRKVSTHIDMLKKYKAIISDLYFNEDVFWSKYVALREIDFKIPLIKDAVYFSFENLPQKCFQLTKGELPFGCHAWYNEQNIDFWKPYLENIGFDINE